jgi:hypothetical protein
MLFEAALMSVTVFSLRFLQEGASFQDGVVFGLLAILWVFGSVVSSQFYKARMIDLRVRNAFNRKIVEGLLAGGTLESSEQWRASLDADYSVDAHDNPINRWHTPSPFNPDGLSRVSKQIETVMHSMVWCNRIVAFALVVVAILAFEGQDFGFSGAGE